MSGARRVLVEVMVRRPALPPGAMDGGKSEPEWGGGRLYGNEVIMRFSYHEG